MVWWMASLAVAVAVGFLLGVVLMVCLGYDPLFRTALALAKKTRPSLLLSKRCIQRQHGQEWRALAALSRSILDRPLTLDEWAQLDRTLCDATSLESATCSLPSGCDDTLDELPGPTRLLMVHREVAHLMTCLCGTKSMERLDRAIQDTVQCEDSAASLAELAEAYTALGKTPRTIIQTIVAIVGAHARLKKAPVDLAVQVMSYVFAPPLCMSVSTLRHWLCPSHNMLHLMVQHNRSPAEKDAERLHGAALSASLVAASVDVVQTSSFDVSWLNLVADRWFQEYATNPELLATLAWQLNRIVQAKVVDIKAIDSVEISNPVLGSQPPVLSNVAVMPTLHPRELCLSADVEYAGNGSVDVHTRVTLSNLVQHQTTLSLRLHLTKLHGRVRLFIPEPSCDPGFGWITFDHVPTFQLSVESCPPHIEPLPQLGALLTAELEDVLLEHFVLPAWTRVSLPWDLSTPLDYLFSSSHRSSKAEGTPNMAAVAGGFMGEVVGGAMGGRFGGHVARGVGEAVGGHLAKYAAAHIVPIVQEVMASAKNIAHRSDIDGGTSQSVDDLVQLAKQTKLNGDATATIASPKAKPTKGELDTSNSSDGAAKATASPKASGVDVARLVSLAKAKKTN